MGLVCKGVPRLISKSRNKNAKTSLLSRSSMGRRCLMLVIMSIKIRLSRIRGRQWSLEHRLSISIMRTQDRVSMKRRDKHYKGPSRLATSPVRKSSQTRSSGPKRCPTQATTPTSTRSSQIKVRQWNSARHMSTSTMITQAQAPTKRQEPSSIMRLLCKSGKKRELTSGSSKRELPKRSQRRAI